MENKTMDEYKWKLSGSDERVENNKSSYKEHYSVNEINERTLCLVNGVGLPDCISFYDFDVWDFNK